MSISNVSSSDLLYQLYQTGNTTPSAQCNGTSQTQGASQFSQILQSLSADLQSDNLQNAQQDFAQLQQTLQGFFQVQGHHHHHQQTCAGPLQQADGSQGQTQSFQTTLPSAVAAVSQSQSTAASVS